MLYPEKSTIWAHGRAGCPIRSEGPDLRFQIKSDQIRDLSGLSTSRVAPPVLLGIAVIDFCFYGQSSHVT